MLGVKRVLSRSMDTHRAHALDRGTSRRASHSHHGFRGLLHMKLRWPQHELGQSAGSEASSRSAHEGAPRHHTQQTGWHDAMTIGRKALNDRCECDAPLLVPRTSACTMGQELFFSSNQALLLMPKVFAPTHGRIARAQLPPQLPALVPCQDPGRARLAPRRPAVAAEAGLQANPPNISPKVRTG